MPETKLCPDRIGMVLSHFIQMKKDEIVLYALIPFNQPWTTKGLLFIVQSNLVKINCLDFPAFVLN